MLGVRSDFGGADVTRRMRVRKTARSALWTLGGAAITALMMLPIYWMVISGFMTQKEMFHVPPYLWPIHPTLNIWRTVIASLAPSLLNSVIISFGTMGLTLVVAVPAAYAVAKLRIRGKGPFIMTILASQMLPAVVIAMPLFLLFSRLHLTNSYIGLILADCTFTIPFAILVLQAYMHSVPSELIEAAYIDGASRMRAFFSVVIPVSLPGIATAAVFGFLIPWGDFIYALTMITNSKLQPMTLALYQNISQYRILWPNLMAGSALVALPVIIFVLAANRFVSSGMTAGAVKE